MSGAKETLLRPNAPLRGHNTMASSALEWFVVVFVVDPEGELSGETGPRRGWRPGGTETAGGMMAEHWNDEDDRILEAIERDRHRPSTREHPE